ncbi:PIN domain-containing protein [Brevibacillus sp. IT-7CA2]|uniref:hypothetical protein n=1 Tax=Brevibacillus sp. IT-7CA2 TaxID=3026436 RepID=UPI0039E07AAB
MPVSYNIQAEIVDIRTDTPKPIDEFLVDTNVWFWMTYSRASLGDNPPCHYQVTHYPTYISNALNYQSKLYRCGLSLAELAHIIERNEKEIYNKSNVPLKPKEYRHNLPQERKGVVSQIEVAWKQVKGLARSIEGLIIDETSTDHVMANMASQLLDGYDLFILDSINKTGIIKVITDDGDYTSVPNIQIFTANRNVIDAARTQGKLISR